MTHHSSDRLTSGFNTSIGGSFGAGSPWLEHLASPRALMAHVGTMLCVTAALALLNLVFDPAGLWARALLIVWLVLLVAHGVGIVILRLLNDERAGARDVRQNTPYAYHGPASPWSQAAGGGDVTVGAPMAQQTDDPWRQATAPDDTPDLTWPEAPEEQGQEASHEGGRSDEDGANGWNEKVPWRAATEIAWLRNRRDATEGREPRQRDSAS